MLRKIHYYSFVIRPGLRHKKFRIICNTWYYWINMFVFLYHRYFQISMYCAVRQTSGTHKISFSHTFLLHWVWKVTPLYAWLLLPLIFTVSLLLASPIFIHSRWEILINGNSKELYLQDIPFEAYSGKHENLTYFWMGEKTLKSFFTICKWKPQIKP